MSEKFQPYSIRELAANAPQSFTDGDWVEAPHIRDNGIRLIQTGNVGIGHFIDRSKKYISQTSFDALNCKEIFPGDLLICRLAEPIGRACFAPDLGERMITSVDVTILRVNKSLFDPRFIAFCINSPETLLQCEVVAGGTTRQRISRSNLGKMKIKAPKLGQQRRIAEILSTLEESIEQTETLIAKMQQVKAGLMYDLFTRGVTPDGHLRPTREQAPDLYKESPLGWIPKEWEIKSIAAIAESLVDGPFGSNLKSEHYVVEPGVRVVRLQNIQEGYYNDSDPVYVSQRHADYLSRNVVNPGDVLIAALGDENYPVGRSCCYPADLSPAINKADCFRLRCWSDIAINTYIMHFLNTAAARSQIKRYEQGVTRRRTNLGNLRRIIVTLPDIDEQSRIIQRLLAVNKRVEAGESQVEKLRQQKQGLMHDLLTGRVWASEHTDI